MSPTRQMTDLQSAALRGAKLYAGELPREAAVHVLDALYAVGAAGVGRVLIDGRVLVVGTTLFTAWRLWATERDALDVLQRLFAEAGDLVFPNGGAT